MALRGRGRSVGMVPGLLRRVSGSAAPAAAAPPAAAPPAPVRVSLVVERNALVVPAPTPLEAAYGRYQERVADERSKPFVAEFFTKKTDTKAGAGAAADDNDPAAEDDAEDKVIYAPMATEADNAGNTTSMQRQVARPRRLNEQLVLEDSRQSEDNGAPVMCARVFVRVRARARHHRPAADNSRARCTLSFGGSRADGSSRRRSRTAPSRCCQRPGRPL